MDFFDFLFIRQLSDKKFCGTIFKFYQKFETIHSETSPNYLSIIKSIEATHSSAELPNFKKIKMLILLIKTRLRFYVNFIRHHFNRRMKIELALILLLFIYLLGRSPADIGYNLQFLFSKAFVHQWITFWANSLPIFYLLFELFAYLTMRSSGEWHLLGSLPFARTSIISYHFWRYIFKTLVILFWGTLPFLIIQTSFLTRLFHFFLAMVILFLLKLVAFLQAFQWRKQSLKWYQKIFPWCLIEAGLLGGLWVGGPGIRLMLVHLSYPALLILFIGIALIGTLSQLIRHIYEPGLIESQFVHQRFSGYFTPALRFLKRIHKPTTALIYFDLLFLIRRKRSLFLVILIETGVLFAAVLAQDTLDSALVSIIFIQIIFSWLFILNMAFTLFERDTTSASLFKFLALSPARLWYSRWILMLVLTGLPLLLPALVCLFKFTMNLRLFSLLLTTLFGIPALLAAFFCNTGFALFPQAKLAGYSFNILILLALLFWFYMPFGSILILAIMLIWIRKSQRHFQNVEFS